MMSRPRFWSCLLGAATLAMPHLAVGQIIFSDSNFNAGSYTTASVGTADIRFGLNYSNFDMFGDGFLTVQVPPSPRGGGSTTGVFLSANNNSLIAGQQSSAFVMPNGVNVGTGTANEDFVMRVDVFNSTGAGIDNGSGTVAQTGTTNYSFLGVNQANTSAVQIRDLGSPGATGSQPGQGLGLAITADAGAADDYMPIYGGAHYADRTLTVIQGQAYSQSNGANTGLIQRRLVDYWNGKPFSATKNFEFDETDVPADTSNNLIRFTGEANYFAPDPTNPAGWKFDGTGADKSPTFDAFPEHNAPLHYSGGGVTSPSFLAPNTALNSGVPYNKWATHELYWVDGTFTYAITYDGVTIPVLQITPDNDGLNGNDNIFSAFSSAGTGVLGFWDRFGGSIALAPDGANFVIYDNLEFEVADAGDVPNIISYLEDGGYIASAAIPGDFDGDGNVDGRDFLAWQRGQSPSPLSAGDLAEWQGAFGGSLTAAVVIPEPSSLMLVASFVGIGLLGGRRR